MKLRPLIAMTALSMALPACVITTSGDDDGADDDDDDDDEPDTGSGGEMGYDFDDTAPEDMVQVDRMGVPAINTAVISSKDDYNGSTPADDAAGTYVDEIVDNVTGLHDALDDDLMGAGLTPCAVMTCVEQAAPLVVPDVPSIDPAAPAGFPNGRQPADPVIDITLAVVLLDLSVEGQDAATLADLPLNPPANDVAFPASFPYLAEPN